MRNVTLIETSFQTPLPGGGEGQLQSRRRLKQGEGGRSTRKQPSPQPTPRGRAGFETSSNRDKAAYRDKAARCHRGHTLIELVASMTSATLLMTGLASAILISSNAFQMDSGSQANKGAAAGIQADLTADLQHAINFSERTANAVTFTVPDRDGDLIPETIRYAWSGSLGNPLTYTYNGGTAVTLVDDVQRFNLSYLMRAEYPVYEEFTEAKLVSEGNQISVEKPVGTTAGDLLIAAVVTRGDRKSSLAAPANWNLIVVENRAIHVTLGVWWKIAQPSEPALYTFSWGGSRKHAYAWIMRFTEHNPTFPINAWTVTNTGKNSSPPSPAVTTNVNKTLILRLGGFKSDGVIVDSPGLPNHAAITADASHFGEDAVSGGAGYATSSAVGGSGTSTFALTKNKESVTVTIAIAPNNKP